MKCFETPQDMLRAIEGGVEIKEATLVLWLILLSKACCYQRKVAMDEDDVKDS